MPVSAPPKLGGQWEVRERGHEGDDEEERYEEMRRRGERKMREKEKARAEKAKAAPTVDPQQALENVLRDLEDDFELHKRWVVILSFEEDAADLETTTGSTSSSRISTARWTPSSAAASGGLSLSISRRASIPLRSRWVPSFLCILLRLLS